MDARDADPTTDVFRDELVAFLAKRLGVPHEVALSTLGDWLLDFERTHARLERAHRHR
jgi:hypothetical protein